MQQPEYLALFSNDGDIKVSVKFKDHDGGVADQAMHADEILQLINQETGEFYTNIRFDDWPFEIYKYHLDPIKKKLVILVRKQKLT